VIRLHSARWCGDVLCLLFRGQTGTCCIYENIPKIIICLQEFVNVGEKAPPLFY
jgi:hypothetical protein